MITTLWYRRQQFMIHRKQILDIKYLFLTISSHSRKIKCLKRESIKTGQKKCKETFDKILRHRHTILRLHEIFRNTDKLFSN